jgi:hypothetical protein
MIDTLRKPTEVTYYYKDKPYKIVAHSKIKLSGLADLFYIYNPEGYYMGNITHDEEWINVVIYQCLYDNPDGDIWVREREQFYELFKSKD